MVQMIFVTLIIKGYTSQTKREIYNTLRRLRHHHGIAEVEQGLAEGEEGGRVIQISSPGGSNHSEIFIAVGKIAQEYRGIKVSIDQFPTMLKRLTDV